MVVGCCGVLGLFGCVLKAVLPNLSTVSVAGIFRGQESELSLCSGEVCWIVEYSFVISFFSFLLKRIKKVIPQL